MFRLTFAHLQYGEEGLLRDLDAADLFHSAVASLFVFRGACVYARCRQLAFFVPYTSGGYSLSGASFCLLKFIFLSRFYIWNFA